MKFLYNWLKKLLNTEKSDEKAPENQLAHSFKNVVVGKIMEINKHPNADRLKLVKVDIGSKELEVVCGASNIEIGQKVPVALVGAKLPGMSAQGGSAPGGEIKEAEIRGVKSFGMLCAQDELGLGTDHGGIMILDEKAEIGMEFAKYIALL
jgi:phenylalanyl-tRNA synthetase beta chain